MASRKITGSGQRHFLKILKVSVSGYQMSATHRMTFKICINNSPFIVRDSLMNKPSKY